MKGFREFTIEEPIAPTAPSVPNSWGVKSLQQLQQELKVIELQRLDVDQTLQRIEAAIAGTKADRDAAAKLLELSPDDRDDVARSSKQIARCDEELTRLNGQLAAVTLRKDKWAADHAAFPHDELKRLGEIDALRQKVKR